MQGVAVDLGSLEEDEQAPAAAGQPSGEGGSGGLGSLGGDELLEVPGGGGNPRLALGRAALVPAAAAAVDAWQGGLQCAAAPLPEAAPGWQAAVQHLPGLEAAEALEGVLGPQHPVHACVSMQVYPVGALDAARMRAAPEDDASAGEGLGAWEAREAGS